MVLGAQTDASYLSVSKSGSRAGAHIILSEDDPILRPNGPVLALSKIIRFFLASAAEAELAGCCICATEMAPLRQTLLGMEWPHPKSPIQLDNTISKQTK